MLEDKLKDRLLNMGYQRLESNSTGIYLYYFAEAAELKIISVFHTENGNELTAIQYEHILDQMKENFERSFPHKIKLLSLILTRYPDRVKQLCSATGKDSHWILDLSTNRLMIYEMQEDNYAGIRKMIEQLLMEEELQLQPNKATGNIPFTWFNTVLIIINLLAFIITKYTGVFGGDLKSFYQGSLNWYFVFKDNQYYRLITSMFMHADWSHLLNNMFVMLFLGATLERALGRLKYLFIYFGAGILAGITSISYNMWRENSIFDARNSVMAIGASGAIFGLVGALLYIVVINRGRLEEISTRQIIIFIILSLYGGIANVQIDQAAHIGGFLSGIILALIIYRRPHRYAPDIGISN